MAPPKKLKLSEVPAYLDRQHEIEVTRQTVYNWVKKGRKGTTLRTVKKAGTICTTEKWVDDFLANIS